MALVRKAARQIQTLPSAADASAQLFPTSEVDLQRKERDERCEIRKLLKEKTIKAIHHFFRLRFLAERENTRNSS